MSEINLNVDVGQTKTLTFNTKDKYNSEDIVFNIETTGTLKAAAGTNINSVGTPTVGVSTTGDTTTLTFNYLKGTTGAQGYQGKSGVDGVQGFQGLQGIKGTDGSRGLQGLQGYQGIKGTDGSRGLQGFQGYQGKSGVDGVQGFQGLQGIKGTDGSRGLQGFQGYQGIKGTDGSRGLQGFQGYQGKSGVDGLQGLQGTKGLQGTTGLQGTQGLQGKNGTDGTRGVQGYQGYQGKSGVDGLQGLQGATGSKGSKGEVGSQGYQGYQGTRGATGSLGPQGLQGIPGLTGANGVQGYQGLQGPAGTGGASMEENTGICISTTGSIVASPFGANANTILLNSDTNGRAYECALGYAARAGMDFSVTRNIVIDLSPLTSRSSDLIYIFPDAAYELTNSLNFLPGVRYNIYLVNLNAGMFKLMISYLNYSHNGVTNNMLGVLGNLITSSSGLPYMQYGDSAKIEFCINDSTFTSTDAVRVDITFDHNGEIGNRGTSTGTTDTNPDNIPQFSGTKQGSNVATISATSLGVIQTFINYCQSNSEEFSGMECIATDKNTGTKMVSNADLMSLIIQVLSNNGLINYKT